MNLNIMDWTETYLKYKDTVQRKITKITKNPEKEELICELKDGTIHTYICKDNLEDKDTQKIKNNRVSCLNTKKNVDWVIKNWQEIKNTDTIFLFANPKKAMHWSLNPKLHDRITDKTALKQGLKTLLESIPEI
ncbi:hypothetical protein KO361_05560 [Candidatus Woesearchaeota archaeon]|jgi:hypothetical protein|nr:hypothetical protein [Candidatus Woesearchaeota archaeon]